MSSELRDLYQEVILDHNRQPRNFRVLPQANHHADGHNPLCGDKVTIYLQVEAGVIKDISFQGAGCAISTASASLMTESLKGKTVAEAAKLFDGFHKMITSEPSTFNDDGSLGKLTVLSGVCEFPMRIKCATLAWHTLNSALRDEPTKVVSTE